MIENFWAYIDSLGEIPEDELFLDIDETMEYLRKKRIEKEDE